MSENSNAPSIATAVSTDTAAELPCPCGTGKTYLLCCAPIHRDEYAASTAEALMRSRYSAYAMHNAEYLNKTHHPSTLDEDLKASLKDSFERCQWTGLKITGRKAGTAKDIEGEVRFEASFTQDNKPYVLKETSRFVKENGRWLYLDGTGGIEPVKTAQPGRNDPCWCGSGKKFKKCHGG